MKMNKIKDNKIFHLITAGGAATLALTMARKSRWRLPLLGLAGWELWNGLSFQSNQDEAIPFEKAPEKTHTALVNGIEMRWEEHGDSSANTLPVVMVHGLPTNPRAWRYIIPLLAKKGVRCLAWEQVGFGRSMEAGLDLDISIPKQAEYLYDWLQHLGISKAIFVAHDYGGGVTQQLLVNHPEIVAGVVLSDSVAYDNWPVTAVRMAQSLNGAIENLPPAMVKPFFLAGISNLGHENSAIKEESVGLFWEPYNTPIGPKAFAHQLRHFSAKDTEKVGKQLEEMRLDIPSRVIWGDRDPLGIPSGERLSKALNTSLIKISGGRHFTIEDHPEIISTAVTEVIDEIKD